MHGIPKFHNPVMYLVESDNKEVSSGKDIFQRKWLSAFKA
jgi:hypothetical protein